jgi:hypothetical protein
MCPLYINSFNNPGCYVSLSFNILNLKMGREKGENVEEKKRKGNKEKRGSKRLT